jgi:hypothetical protein
VEKLFIVPLKVPLALNDAGKLMELGIVSLGVTSFAVAFYQNQALVSGGNGSTAHCCFAYDLARIGFRSIANILPFT